MDMGNLAEMLMLLLCVVWAIGAVLGIVIGRLARTPGAAFLCGAVTAVAAGLFAGLFFFGIARWQDLMLICLPPGVVAGCTSATLRARAKRQRGDWSDWDHVHLTPDVERTARSRFTPGQRQADAIQPVDDG